MDTEFGKKLWDTLFLDRDGVINKRKKGGYITHPDELELLPGAARAIRNLNPFFERILIITNQQGIGKGLMTESDLEEVHIKMLRAIEAERGWIDKIYFAPQLASQDDYMRKPQAGMIIKAIQDFPKIELHRSWVVGDTTADLKLAYDLGIDSAFVRTPQEAASDWEQYKPKVVVKSLVDFAKHLEQKVLNS